MQINLRKINMLEVFMDWERFLHEADAYMLVGCIPYHLI